MRSHLPVYLVVIRCMFISCFQDAVPDSIATLTLLSCTSTIKQIMNVQKLTDHLESFDVSDVHMTQVDMETPPNLQFHIVHTWVHSIDTAQQVVHTAPPTNADATSYPYDKLILAMGAHPTPLIPHSNLPPSPYILSIRDTESVSTLSERLKHSRRMMIVGNGGIALELVYALHTALSEVLKQVNSEQAAGGENDLSPPELVWSVHTGYIGNTFLDESSSAFMIPWLFPEKDPDNLTQQPQASSSSSSSNTRHNTLPADTTSSAPTTHTAPKQTVTTATNVTATLPPAAPSSGSTATGAALGPNWLNRLHLDTLKPKHKTPFNKLDTSLLPHLTLELSTEVTEVYENHSYDPNAQSDDSYPLRVTISNGKVYDCDIIIAATGVTPNTGMLGLEFVRGPDGGVQINDRMLTSVPNVYAAGDVAFADFGAMKDSRSHWFQVRIALRDLMSVMCFVTAFRDVTAHSCLPSVWLLHVRVVCVPM